MARCNLKTVTKKHKVYKSCSNIITFGTGLLVLSIYGMWNFHAKHNIQTTFDVYAIEILKEDYNATVMIKHKKNFSRDT